jgi:pyruvate-formate lyase-activating enzyme
MFGHKQDEIWLTTDADGTTTMKPISWDYRFSNLCNFACAYCNPSLSSKWLAEIEMHGPYPTSQNFNNINSKIYLEKDDNPYVKAFWSWWPEVYPGLDTLRVTGGEPLLTKHTYKLIDKILETPNPNLNLSFNSNLGIDLQKFIESISRIRAGIDVKKIRIFTSNESHGNKSEYIRFGINYDQWLSNIDLLLSSLPDVNLGIMVTYNMLAVSSFTDFLKDIKKIK